MKVTLIKYDEDAIEQLIFTKNTRLQMNADLMEKINEMTVPEQMEQLEYMADTIPSSWEFIDYTFLLEDVTRAFTHQLVRTREASYAQQTMRVLDKTGWTYRVPPKIEDKPDAMRIYCDCMADIDMAYSSLLSLGVAIEDARGVLPTNIHTNIVAKFNLRRLAELIAKRSSPRTQDEYREVIEAMKEAVLEVHPWAAMFLDSRKMQAAKKLDNFINEHNGPTYLIKAVDVLRK